MRRTAVALASGVILGIVATLISITLSGGWYQYTLLENAGPSVCRYAERVTKLSEGWQVVPDQADACYLRRSRVRLN